MKQMTDKDQYQAFMRWWTKDFPCKEHDEAIDIFNRAEIKNPKKYGWLRAAREALMLSADVVSNKLKISAAGYSKLEQMETEGKITLETLARAAEALDCELIYAIRPKRRQRFSQLIWQKLLPHAEIHSWVQRSSQQTRPAAVAMIASNLFRDPDFRKKQGWKKRRKSDLK
jgi:transcriptional regulator with XRE-family HTH domain